MLGAIIGDIAGSRFEGRHRCIKTKDFDFFTERCHATDDSMMTLAVGAALREWFGAPARDDATLRATAIAWMRDFGREYPRAGYGGAFRQWIFADDPRPYNSFGNGAAMRVSPCGFAARSVEEAEHLAELVTEVTHNHPEAVKAGKAVAAAVYLARAGKRMEVIRDYVGERYYRVDFRLDDIRDAYTFDVTCQGCVPQAFAAFYESTGFEDAVRNAISLGGDSDTLAAITGGMAGAYYGVPPSLARRARGYLYPLQLRILDAILARFGGDRG